MHFLKHYFFSLVLLASLVAGGFFGYFYGSYTPYIKFIGDIFLNLIFTTIVPLIFFSVASALSKNNGTGSIGRLMGYMFLVFFLTSLTAAVFSLILVKLFPLTTQLQLSPAPMIASTDLDWGKKVGIIYSTVI